MDGTATIYQIKFLSTLPVRGATQCLAHRSPQDVISIHAPREGSDRRAPEGHCREPHFYPRSPRGERHVQRGFDNQSVIFLSTLPARGATWERH